MNRIAAVVGAIGLASAGIPAQAAVINNGIMVEDTGQGLVFLDVIQTENISYNDMQIELLPGGDFFGWRYATQAEIGNLFTNAGIALSTNPIPANAPPVQTLMNILGGPTEIGQTRQSLRGIVDVVAGAGHLVSGYLAIEQAPFGGIADAGSFSTIADSFPPGTNTDTGHWLVRLFEVTPAPAPVPATATLFAFGLAGLAATRRRR
jgi:MYXO-CTERM domain-containing protein